MKKQIFIGLAVAMLPLVAHSQPRDSVPYQWSIKVTRDKQGIPTSAVSIVVNKHSHFVAKVEGNEMKPMDRALFDGWDVPKSSVTACFGWYAGGGDIYYALRRPHLLRIYHRAIDESDEKEQKPKLVLSLKLKR